MCFHFRVFRYSTKLGELTFAQWPSLWNQQQMYFLDTLKHPQQAPNTFKSALFMRHSTVNILGFLLSKFRNYSKLGSERVKVNKPWRQMVKNLSLPSSTLHPRPCHTVLGFPKKPLPSWNDLTYTAWPQNLTSICLVCRKPNLTLFVNNRQS